MKYSEYEPKILAKKVASKETKNEELIQILNELISDGYELLPYIKSIIAENPNASRGLLRRLYDDADQMVVSSVIKNPNMPKEWLNESRPIVAGSIGFDIDHLFK